MKKSIVLALAGIVLSSFQLKDDGWMMFAKVKFASKFFKEYNEYFLVPSFDEKIRLYEGKEIFLKGYNLPLEIDDSNTIILSRYPYSMCFFCGGAGPESVAEVVFKRKPAIKVNQVIMVKGKLRLNAVDVEHVNFILEGASLVTGDEKKQ